MASRRTRDLELAKYRVRIDGVSRHMVAPTLFGQARREDAWTEAHQEYDHEQAVTPSACDHQLPVIEIRRGYHSSGHSRHAWQIRGSGVFNPGADASVIDSIHQSACGDVSSVVQEAGIAALHITPDDLRALAASYERRRDVVNNIFGWTPGVMLRRPQGAFFAFLELLST